MQYRDRRTAYGTLWHNGQIPERFRARLPDNAVVLSAVPTLVAYVAIAPPHECEQYFTQAVADLRKRRAWTDAVERTAARAHLRHDYEEALEFAHHLVQAVIDAQSSSHPLIAPAYGAMAAAAVTELDRTVADHRLYLEREPVLREAEAADLAAQRLRCRALWAPLGAGAQTVRGQFASFRSPVMSAQANRRGGDGPSDAVAPDIVAVHEHFGAPTTPVKLLGRVSYSEPPNPTSWVATCDATEERHREYSEEWIGVDADGRLLAIEFSAEPSVGIRAGWEGRAITSTEEPPTLLFAPDDCGLGERAAYARYRRQLTTLSARGQPNVIAELTARIAHGLAQTIGPEPVIGSSVPPSAGPARPHIRPWR